MCEVCTHTSSLTVNVQQYDPTRTLTLRNAFVADMNRRFKRVAKLVTQAVVTEDVFGLTPSVHTFQTPGKNAFVFKTTDQKITAFLAWLRQIEDAIILEMHLQQGLNTQWRQVPWTDVYIAKAFEQGTRRAKLELKKHGFAVSFLDDAGNVIINPTSLEKLRTLFTRSFNELRGITTTMDTRISSILAEGLFEGQSPRVLARMINSAIISSGDILGIDISYTTKTGKQVSYFMPGRRRAEIMARTETIRAHHIATIAEYRNWAIEGVYVLAEWSTAGDARVCAECAALEGTVWELDAIENLIPLHPQCRCVTIPFVDKTKTK